MTVPRYAIDAAIKLIESSTSAVPEGKILEAARAAGWQTHDKNHTLMHYVRKEIAAPSTTYIRPPNVKP
jgi:hypothetical protein